MGSQFTGALFFRKNYKGYNETPLYKEKTHEEEVFQRWQRRASHSSYLV